MYGPVLARVHAAAFTDTFRPAFDWLVETIYDGTTRPRLFDLGCGDGTWLDFARYHGVPGAGLDISDSFVRLATARKLAVTIGDAANPLIPPGTTAVTALGEVLAYTPAALTGAAKAASRALAPGGVFVFDLLGQHTPEGRSERDGNGWSITSHTQIERDRLIRDITITTAQSEYAETHDQQIFDPAAVADLLVSAGFAPERLDSYGPCPLLPGRFAMRARKLA